MPRRRVGPLIGLILLVLATGTLQFREIRRLRYAESDTGLLPVSAPAPELEIETPGGEKLPWASMRGKLVLVSFWATWCMPCQLEMPEMASFVGSWNADKTRKVDMAFVGVNNKEEPGAVRLFAKDSRYKGVVFAMDFQGKIADTWKAKALPTTYLVSPEGKILDAQVGYTTGSSFQMQRVLRPYRTDPDRPGGAP